MSEFHASDRLGDYLEGDLSLAERARVDSHLAGCSACARELRELRATVALLRSLPDPEPSPRMRSEIQRRIAAGEADAPRVAPFFRQLAEPRIAAALAAGVAALLVFTSVELGTGNLLGLPSDLPSERLAQRVAPAGGGELRPPDARRPRPGGGAFPPRVALVSGGAFGPPVPLRSPQSMERARYADLYGRIPPAVPLRDLDAELERLMRDPSEFLERVRRTAKEARGPMITPLVEQSARHGDLQAVARQVGIAAHPALLVSATR